MSLNPRTLPGIEDLDTTCTVNSWFVYGQEIDLSSIRQGTEERTLGQGKYEGREKYKKLAKKLRHTMDPSKD